MKTASICLILPIFTFFGGCAIHSEFFGKNPVSEDNLSSIYAGSRYQNFNPRFFAESSIQQTYLNVRVASQDSRIDKTEVQILEYSPQFRIDLERTFPQANLPKYKIETRVLTGQLIAPSGSTGFSVVYNVEKTKQGSGSSIGAAWDDYDKSPYSRTTIHKTERWESIKDGLWLAEESETVGIGELTWRHKPGSLDFFHPFTEFRTNTNASASLYYDYSLNRFEKLRIEKNPDPSNLVFEGKDLNIYFLSGKLQLKYNSL